MESTRRELLAWAASVISREMGNHTTGKVVIHLHDGQVQRVNVDRTERPPRRQSHD